MKTETLYHRDFTLMILGQIISLFGNAILRFALSLYVLDTTGSAAIFGGILAVSMIPTVLISPLGGLLADRVNRRNIMVVLDYTTAALIACFALFFLDTGILPVAVIMVLLSVIQSIYQPSVQACIPVLCSNEHLERANGVVIQVNALAGLLGPILGGFLYGFLGLRTILLGSGVCFFLSACMELFLRIPFVRQPRANGLLRTVKEDFSAAMYFLIHENPFILKLLGILAVMNFFISSMIIVGLPYLVKIYLGLSSQHYGIAEGALGVGSILAGCLSGLVAKKCVFRESYRLLMLAGVALVPIGFVMLTPQTPGFSYIVLIISVLVCMICAALFSIYAQTFSQRQTPPALLGKVASLITTVCTCSLPLGQALYGVLFDHMSGFVSLIIFFSCGAGLLVAMAAGKLQQGLPA